MKKPALVPPPSPDDAIKSTVSESAFQANLLMGFSRIHGIRVWRQGVGAFRLVGDGGGRVITFGMAGMADISGITSRGLRIEVEVKAAAGVVREAQDKWAAFIQSMNGIYMLAQYDDTMDMKMNVAARVIELQHRIAERAIDNAAASR